MEQVKSNHIDVFVAQQKSRRTLFENAGIRWVEKVSLKMATLLQKVKPVFCVLTLAINY